MSPESERTTAVTVREATVDDLPVIQRVLYEALGWDPEESLPPIEVVLAHPEAARYHEGWGREGDLGAVAEVSGDVVGGAYLRLFTEDDHGHGFVDERTPELAIAVWGGRRGEGIGGALLDFLHGLAAAAGFEQVSLSVDTANPAAHLYERHGYRLLDTDTSHRMVKRLD